MDKRTARATVAKTAPRAFRPWRVTLYNRAGEVHRQRWFSVHENALRWALRKAAR